MVTDSSPDLRGLDARQRQALVDLIVSVSTHVELDVLLRRVVESAIDMVGARYGAIGVLDESRRHLAEFIHVGIDDDEAARIGELPRGAGILGLLTVDPTAIRLDDLRAHDGSAGFPAGHPVMKTFLGAPIRVRGDLFGNLYLAEKFEGAPFTPQDEELIVAFGTAAGMAIENARLHARAVDLELLETRQQIALELHDTVLQRLFATGVALQGLAARLDDREAASLIESSVADLDETARRIRTTIFDLEESRPDRRMVRNEITDLVAELTETFGLDGSVSFDGPLDELVSAGRGHLADNLLAVLSEGLTNVGRHASAERVDVQVQAVGDLVLSITDDGVGVHAHRAEPGSQPRPGSGQGLANMAWRAEDLGGTFEVREHDVGGTVIEWRVPIG